MEIKNNYFEKRELKLLQQKINTHKKLLECYQIRLLLIDTDKAIKSDYQINEDEIEKIITYSKIDVLKDKIQILENDFYSMYSK
jgi:hypothetical protein